MSNVRSKIHPVLIHCGGGPSERKRDRRVRVAVIDTGVAFSDHVGKTLYDGRMRECRSWFDNASADGSEQKDGVDEDGHGTHLTSLVLDIASFCDVYVAAVFPKRERVSSADASCKGLHSRVANVSLRDICLMLYALTIFCRQSYTPSINGTLI
jgi:hypothetical protein